MGKPELCNHCKATVSNCSTGNCGEAYENYMQSIDESPLEKQRLDNLKQLIKDAKSLYHKLQDEHVSITGVRHTW